MSSNNKFVLTGVMMFFVGAFIGMTINEALEYIIQVKKIETEYEFAVLGVVQLLLIMTCVYYVQDTMKSMGLFTVGMLSVSNLHITSVLRRYQTTTNR